MNAPCQWCGEQIADWRTHACPKAPAVNKGCSFPSSAALTDACSACRHPVRLHEHPGKVCTVCRDVEPLRAELDSLKKRPGVSIFGRVIEEFGFDSDGDLHHEVCDTYIGVDLWTPNPDLDEPVKNTTMKEIMQTAIKHLQVGCPGKEPK